MTSRRSMLLLNGGICATALLLFLHAAISRGDFGNASALNHDGTGPISQRGELPGTESSGSRRSNEFLKRQREVGLAKRVSFAVSRENSFERRRAVLALMKDFDSWDYQLALEACRTAPGAGNGEAETLLLGWTACDPMAALAFAGEDEKTVRIIITAWAQKDGAAAVKWVQRSAVAAQRDYLLPVALMAMAQREPAEALSRIQTLSPSSFGFRNPLSQMMYEDQGRHVGTVLAWVDSLEDPAIRLAALNDIVEFWYCDKTSDELALLVRHPQELERMDLTAPFTQIAARGGNLARTALDQLPPGRARRTALEATVPLLLKKNENAPAEEIIAAFPEEMDDSFLVLCADSAEESGKGLQLASAISDSGIRSQAEQRIWRRWKQLNPVMALKWRDEHGLPDGIEP